MAAYEQVADGEWLRFAKRGHKIACCDCGLVHRIEFYVTEDGQVDVRFKRDNRATAAMKRGVRRKQAANK